jgi:hypothetical protein
MTNHTKYSLLHSRVFLSLPSGRFGAVVGRNSSMNGPLDGASQLCLGARLRHGARASIYGFELLECPAGNRRVHGQPRMALTDAERMAINGGGN